MAKVNIPHFPLTLEISESEHATLLYVLEGFAKEERKRFCHHTSGHGMVAEKILAELRKVPPAGW